jgi:hypothetical protein
VARFYLDENVPEQLLERLAALGHDAVSTNSLGRKETRDHRQILFAAQEARSLVTYNGADFRLLHDAWREWSVAWHLSLVDFPRPGILVMQQDQLGLVAAELALTIDRFARTLDTLNNRLFIWNRR